MKKEVRAVVYDDELRLEAYRFEGIVQPFPNHFHDYYVIGIVEGGERCLICKNKEYVIKSGDILLFSPGDSHGCVQSDSGAFDYRGINIPASVMSDLMNDAVGSSALPCFEENVISDGELACCLRALHEAVMTGDSVKEENLPLFMYLLARNHGWADEKAAVCRDEIESACEFMRRNYSERISLNQLCRMTGLSKSTLLREFTKSKGVTPYRYLENIRISRAKELLGEGIQPIDAAMMTGFSDQSHFTNYFTSFIGLAPGVYRGIFMKK